MYSQHGEEEILLEHFAGRTGTLLDIGAYDGKTFSNTLALIERGWAAILIEPCARAFDKLMDQHRDNPRVKLVNALITAYGPPTLRRFWQCPDALSTTEQRNLDIWRPAGTVFTETWLPALPLGELLSGLEAPLDFVNVDTEGTSVQIAKALLARIMPEVLCVEHDAMEFTPVGYERLYFDGNNVILRRTE